ncbi:MAG TPA: MFS transporter [Chitinophagaceae bacterium]|jgi:fucose permease
MQTWRIKASLFLNYFVFAILLNSVGIVILQVQTSYQVSKSGAAALEPCKDFSIAIVSFLVTSFITRLGYKRAMLIALGFISLICFIIPFTDSFLAFELLFVCVGSSFALIKMSVYSSIGLVTKDGHEHISLMNFIESFFGVGIVAAYFIFPLFIDKTNPGSHSWLNVYFLLGGISLLAFLLLISTSLDESAAKNDEPADTLKDVGGMFRLLFTPLVLLFIVCAFFYVLIEQSIMSWLPTFNKDVLRLNNSLSIQMASILAATIALGRFLAGILLKRLNWLIVLLSCVGLAAIIVLLSMPAIDRFLAGYKGTGITKLADVPLIAFVFPIIGLVLAPIYPAINSVILSSLPKPKHGWMSGLIIFFSAAGGTLGSIITGNIFQYFGGQNAIYFSLVPMTILVVFLALFRRLQTSIKTGY